MALKQARSPIASGPSCRLLEAEQLGSTSVQPFEIEGLIGARKARAFTGSRRPGPMATSRQRHWVHSYPQPPFPAEIPFDAASIAHCAGDILADPVVEHGLPRHCME